MAGRLFPPSRTNDRPGRPEKAEGSPLLLHLPLLLRLYLGNF
jgi:hypothetical protein